MHPMTAFSIGAGSASLGLVFMRIIMAVAFLAYLTVTCVANAIAFRAPRFATAVLPAFFIYAGFLDAFGFYRSVVPRGSGVELSVYYSLIICMLLGVLWGAQRHYLNGAPFAYYDNHGILRIHFDYFSHGCTPYIKYWLISIAVGILATQIVPLTIWPPIFAVIGHVFAVIGQVWGFIDNGLQLYRLTPEYICYYPCESFWQAVIEFPNGYIWFPLAFLVPAIVKRIVRKLAERGVRWAARSYPLVRLAAPGLALFFLTTVYVLTIDYWFTWFSWGIYVLWLGWQVARSPYGRWLAVARVAAVLLGLVVLSDVDWAFKQHANATVFGTSDYTRNGFVWYPEPAGYVPPTRPNTFAWGGVPRMMFGVSPSGWAADFLRLGR